MKAADTGEPRPFEVWSYEQAPPALRASCRLRDPRWVLLSYAGASVQDREELLSALRSPHGRSEERELPRRGAVLYIVE